MTAIGMGNSKKPGRGQPCQDPPGHLPALRSSPQRAWEVIIIITSLELPPVASFRLAREQKAGSRQDSSPDIPPSEVLRGNKPSIKCISRRYGYCSQHWHVEWGEHYMCPVRTSFYKPQNNAIPGAKQDRLMIVEKVKCIQKSLTESVCLMNIMRVSVNARSSPFPCPSFLPWGGSPHGFVHILFYEAPGKLHRS